MAFLFTTLNSNISPQITTADASLADWDWGDFNTTTGNNAPTHTYIDGLPSHDVDLQLVDFSQIVNFISAGQDLTALNLSLISSATGIWLNGNSNLGGIDLSLINPNVNVLNLSGTGFTGIYDGSSFSNIGVLTASGNDISSIIMPSSTSLWRLHLDGNNNISSLDISSNTSLREVQLQNCALSSSEIDNILINLDSHGEINGTLNYSNNPGEGSLTAYNEYQNLVSKGWTITGTIPLHYDLFTTISQGTITPTISTADSSLVSWDWGDGNRILDNNAPTHTYTDSLPNHDVSIFDIDPLTVSVLNIDGYQITDVDVSNLTQLTLLNCGYNNILALDLSNNTQLNELWCYTNNISTLDISNNTQLTYLSCFNNNILALDLSNNTQLTVLSCGDNNLTVLDVSNNTLLEVLHCYTNNISTLDISNNTQLTLLNCGGNNLTVLDVSNNTQLNELWCYTNNISSLDISSNTDLIKVQLQNCALSSSKIDNILIDLDNHGQISGNLNYSNNPGENSLTAYKEYQSLISKGWTITGMEPLLNVFGTSSQGTINVDVTTSSSSVDWDWGDGNVTLDANTTSHTYTDLAPIHTVSIFDIDPFLLTAIDFSNNELYSVDVECLPNLINVDVSDNNISYSHIDKMIIDLDNNGQINGTLDFSGNQNPTFNSYNSYQNLIAKGWNLTGVIPPSDKPVDYENGFKYSWVDLPIASVATILAGEEPTEVTPDRLINDEFVASRFVLSVNGLLSSNAVVQAQALIDRKTLKQYIEEDLVNNITWVAEALPGTLKSDYTWRVKKVEVITIGSFSSTNIIWAGGSADFIHNIDIGNTINTLDDLF